MAGDSNSIFPDRMLRRERATIGLAEELRIRTTSLSCGARNSVVSHVGADKRSRFASQTELIAWASTVWDGPWMNRQHMCNALSSFCRVTYVQTPQPWHKSVSPRDESFFKCRCSRENENLHIIRLPKVAARRTREGVWNRLSERMVRRGTRDVVAGSRQNQVFYFWHPSVYAATRVPDSAIVVYHVYDIDPTSAVGSPAFIDLCRRADIVICGTAEQASFIPRDDVEVVPNGVAIEWFDHSRSADTLPDSIRRLPRPLVGFVGSITRRLDFDVLDSVAELEHCNLLLLGPRHSLDGESMQRLTRLADRENVFLCDAVAAREVPSVISQLAVGLMPYRLDGHCSIASPIKLYEYAAAGVPSVSTALESYKSINIAGLVDTADDAAGFRNHVARLLASPPSDSSRQALRDAAAENSWVERARRVVQLIQKHPKYV